MAVPESVRGAVPWPGSVPSAGAGISEFDAPGLLAVLDGCDGASLDALDFGVIRMDRALTVAGFNRTGIEMTGLTPERVLGRPFFSAVAPCMNNVLVAGRFAAEPELDAMVEYVLTFRVRPEAARLRLLASVGSAHMYLLMQRA